MLRVLSHTRAAVCWMFSWALSTLCHTECECQLHTVAVAQAASRADAVHTAITAADGSGTGYLTTEQLEQGMAAAGLKFTKHQVRCNVLHTTASSDHLAPSKLALQDKHPKSMVADHWHVCASVR
jgi:hypothetical protein